MTYNIWKQFILFILFLILHLFDDLNLEKILEIKFRG